MGYCIEHLPSRISIGRETETGVTDIRIDCTDWLKRWPGMAVAAIFCPPGGTPYIVDAEMSGNSLVWHVRDTDTATPGIGQLELTGEADGKRKLSALVDVQVARRLPGTAGDAPNPAKPWVDSVLGAAERITGMQVQATTLDAGSSATAAWDGEQGLLTIGLPKGEKGEHGKDAVVDATLTQSGQAADAKVTGDVVSQLKTDITKAGTIKECVVIADGVEMAESVATAKFAFNAFEYRKIVIQIEATAASADAQIIVCCIVNREMSTRELIRIPTGAISKAKRISVIEWYPSSTGGLNIQTASVHVLNTNISVMKTARFYQSDMTKIVFSSELGDAVIPAGTKFYIWGFR